jgi:hypothetical protein
MPLKRGDNLNGARNYFKRFHDLLYALGKGPLKESCTVISYEADTQLSFRKRLEYVNDKVLDEC